jgi:hypothetical protein
VFDMPVCLRALLALATSDSNKVKLATADVIDNVTRNLQLYLEDGPALESGGGGKDEESASLAAEVLLQLSYVFAEDEELQQQEQWTRLQPLLEGVAGSGRLSSQGAQHIKGLLMRLRQGGIGRGRGEAAAGEEVKEEEAVVDGEGEGGAQTHDNNNNVQVRHTPTHIMLSYCWAEKEIVKKLGEKLRAAGKDVWRDEVSISLSKYIFSCFLHNQSHMLCVLTDCEAVYGCRKGLQWWGLCRATQMT